MKNQTNKLKSIILSCFVITHSLFADGDFFEEVPRDSDVLRIVETQVIEKYNHMFFIKEYVRLNGYWKDKLNGKYTVHYQYKLISKHDIISKKYVSDIMFYYRLNTLKFNANIYANESFTKEEKINMIYTESGWQKDKTFIEIGF
jgi:hypothetical protein